MIPASQAATRYPPNRGRNATTRPATISITPTTYRSVSAPVQQIGELGGQVEVPVDEHVGELVEAEQDRCHDESDPQQPVGLESRV